MMTGFPDKDGKILTMTNAYGQELEQEGNAGRTGDRQSVDNQSGLQSSDVL